MKSAIALLAWTLCASVGTCADNPLAWSRFRGPDGSGIAESQKPPVQLGPDKNVKWKVSVPPGSSSPIVTGDNLVVTAFENDKLYTIAYRRADGAEVWRQDARAKQIEKYYKGEGSPAASTCATDGTRIVTYFGSCGLICYDLAGKELWRYEMSPAKIFADFGSGVSPIVADGTVVLVRDEINGSRILAIDAASGSRKWEKKRQSPISYCTPTIWDTPAVKQIVAAGQGRMIAYDLKTGEEKWSVAGMPTGPCGSPFVVDGYLFYSGWSPGGPDDPQNRMPSFDELLKQADTNKDGIVSKEEAQRTMFKDSFDMLDTNKDGKLTRDEWDVLYNLFKEGKNSAFALKLGATGDVSDSQLLWRRTKGLGYVPTALVYRGQFLVIKDGGLMTAYDAKTGEPIYVQERIAASGRYYASPVAANGHIYFTSLDDGAITVLKAGTTKPEIVARNPKLGERVAATPAIADNALYVRTEQHLYAFAEKK
jgi:outer membrane protein assembly factor BamB